MTAHIVADNFHASILNLYPYDPWEFTKLLEFRHFGSFPPGVAIQPRNLPDVFSRYYIEMLLTKSPASYGGMRPVTLKAYGTDRKLTSAAELGKGLPVTADEPLSIDGPEKHNSDDPRVAVTLLLRFPGSKGGFRIEDATGDVVYEDDVTTLLGAIAEFHANLAFTLQLWIAINSRSCPDPCGVHPCC